MSKENGNMIVQKTIVIRISDTKTIEKNPEKKSFLVIFEPLHDIIKK